MKSSTSSLLLFGCFAAVFVAFSGCNSPGQNSNSGADNDTSGQTSTEDTTPETSGQAAPDPLFLKLTGNSETLEVVAGKSAGILELKAPSDTLVALLGTPDSTAVDMCKDLSAWQSEADDADADVARAGAADAEASAGAGHAGTSGIRVYSLCDNDLDMRKSIQIVALRGAPFETAEGASAKSTFPELKQQYPSLQVLGSLQSENGTPTLFIADDIEGGIAFELSDTTAQGRCLGVLVHLPGKAVTATNIPLYPGLKSLRAQ